MSKSHIFLIKLAKVTHCAGHISANTRPHQLCWGGWEIGTAISCTECSQVAGIIQKVGRNLYNSCLARCRQNNSGQKKNEMFTFITQRRLNQERTAVHLVLIQHTKMFSFLTRRQLNQKSGQLYSFSFYLDPQRPANTNTHTENTQAGQFQFQGSSVDNQRLLKVLKQSLLQVYQLTVRLLSRSMNN